MEKKAYVVRFAYQKRVIAREDDFDNEVFMESLLTQKDADKLLKEPEKYLDKKYEDRITPFGSLVSDFGLVEEVEVVSGRMKGLKGMVLISPDPTIDAYVKVRLIDDRGEEIVAYFLPEELKILK